MYKTCSTCGRLHRFNEKCPHRKQKAGGKRDGREEDGFRSSSAWQRIREQIRRRDFYMCRYCFDSGKGVQSRRLEVHHIEPLCEAWGRRLDEENLITLCSECHELAERGKINREQLHRLAVEPPIGHNV